MMILNNSNSSSSSNHNKISWASENDNCEDNNCEDNIKDEYDNLRTTEVDVDGSTDSTLKVEWCTNNQIIFANTTYNSLVNC